MSLPLSYTEVLDAIASDVQADPLLVRVATGIIQHYWSVAGNAVSFSFQQDIPPGVGFKVDAAGGGIRINMGFSDYNG